jgi:outer membrane protein OmpA-like peptidoglycan-associated protein
MHTRRFSCFSVALAMMLAIGIPVAVPQTNQTSNELPKTSSLSLGEKRKIEGTIAARDGDRLTVRPTAAETNVVVKLSSFSEIIEKKSNPFRRAQKYHAGQLVPGLSVEVEGRGDSDGTLVADKIRFTNDDFLTARTVDTRVTPVEENSRRMSGQIAELEAVSNAARGGARAAQETADRAHERITSLDDYEPVHNATILFKAGSSVLSSEARRSLDEVARQAKNLKGFVIEVAGFASSEGDPAVNRRLSRQRAQVAAEYLAEQHEISLRRIMLPAGYGVSHPVANNSSRTGRQENRRAEVTVLVSRGLITQASASQLPADNR